MTWSMVIITLRRLCVCERERERTKKKQACVSYEQRQI